MTVNWSRVLGEYSQEKTKKKAEETYADLVEKGVSHEEALTVVKTVYCKSKVVKGEREQLMTAALNSSSGGPNPHRHIVTRTGAIVNEAGEVIGEADLTQPLAPLDALDEDIDEDNETR